MDHESYSIRSRLVGEIALLPPEVTARTGSGLPAPLAFCLCCSIWDQILQRFR